MYGIILAMPPSFDKRRSTDKACHLSACSSVTKHTLINEQVFNMTGVFITIGINISDNFMNKVLKMSKNKQSVQKQHSKEILSAF